MEKLYQIKRKDVSDELKTKLPTLYEAKKPLSWWFHICEESELEEINQVSNKPTLVPILMTNELRDQCQAYIDFIFSDEYYEDNNYDAYIVEMAMQTFFGKDIYDKINARIK